MGREVEESGIAVLKAGWIGIFGCEVVGKGYYYGVVGVDEGEQVGDAVVAVPGEEAAAVDPEDCGME